MVNEARSRLIEATQSCFHVLDDAPPAFAPVRLDGVQGRLGSTTYPPMWNEIGMAAFETRDVARPVEGIVARFRDKGQPFGWLVGPSSSPPNLVVHLEAAGLQRLPSEAGVGMVLADGRRRAGPTAGVRVEEVDFDDVWRAATLVASAFGSGMDRHAFGAGMTVDDARAFIEALASLQSSWHSRAYLAFVRGRREPAGFGLMIDSGRDDIVWMIAAGTQRSARGRGVYRSLVDRRAADAYADGAGAVITTVNRATASGVARRVGFQELCELELFGWSPTSA